MSSVQTWSVDPVHSTIEFEVPHMGFSIFRGKFKGVEGTVWMNPDDVSGARVEAKVDTTTVVAVGDGLYKALVGKDFFVSDEHRDLVFKSNKVTTAGDGGATIEGELTLRGVTRPLTLKSARLGTAKNPFAQKQMIAFSAEGELNRGDYGIVWNVPLDNGGKYLGERVRILLNIELLAQSA